MASTGSATAPSLESPEDLAEPQAIAGRQPGGIPSPLALMRPLVALLLLFLFLVGVQSLSTGIKGLGAGTLDAFMTAVQNPFMGVVTGILATTLVQSSSVTTSLVVGMVASGVLPIGSAIPMIMGANIGTTVTNTIAALAQIGNRREFRRAFAAATCHDFFNYLAVIVLLPLEIATGFLAQLSAWVNGLLPTAGGLAYHSPIKGALKASVKGLQGAVSSITAHETAQSVVLIVLSIVLIFAALSLIVKVMRSLVLSRVDKVIQRVLSRGVFGKLSAMTVGAGITAAVQSSSITTSIMVPLAGANLVRLWQVFPITVGANIGTTLTALLASMAVSGEGAMVGRQIALVHLLFNLVAMVLFYVPPPTRKLPMYAAMRLAKYAAKNRVGAIVYVASLFYGVPAVLVFAFG